MTTGTQAEELAASFLQQHGLVLLQRNYRGNHGEIDLIMLDGDTLVFVEVRLRSSNKYGGAAASIGPAKQERLSNTAHQYLSTLRRIPPCRFDAVLLASVSDETSIEWVKNAFGS